LKANIEDLEKERDENKILRDRMKVLEEENAYLVKKASEEKDMLERSFERMHSAASNVTIRPSKPVPVEPFEAGEVVNEVFAMEGVEETSPAFHGFPLMDSGGDSAAGGSSITEQLSQKIVALEESSSGSSSSTNSGEVPAVIPKRKERSEDSSSPNNSKVKKSDKHPDIGRTILIDTIKGKVKYIVESKKNNRSEDYIYVLVNSDKKSKPFDLKDIFWEYFDEIDPLGQSQQETETPFQE